MKLGQGEGEEDLLRLFLKSPCRAFSQVCPALINSSGVPETVVAELLALVIHQREGQVSPPVLKLSCRPGKGLSIIFTGAHIPMAPISHWTVLLSQSHSVPSLSPHSPGEAGASGPLRFPLCEQMCAGIPAPLLCFNTHF